MTELVDLSFLYVPQLYTRTLHYAERRQLRVRKTPILDTSGEKFSWIRFTFLEVVLHRTSVRDLGACNDLVRTYLACLACPEMNCLLGISVSLVLGGKRKERALKIAKNKI